MQLPVREPNNKVVAELQRVLWERAQNQTHLSAVVIGKQSTGNTTLPDS